MKPQPCFFCWFQVICRDESLLEADEQFPVLKCSRTEPVSSTVSQQPLPSTVSHSSFLWTTPPTARQKQRHTGGETDSKERQEGMTRKEKKKGRTKRSRQDKETEDETDGSCKLWETNSMFVDMLTHGRTQCSFSRGKLHLKSLNRPQIHSAV